MKDNVDTLPVCGHTTFRSCDEAQAFFIISIHRCIVKLDREEVDHVEVIVYVNIRGSYLSAYLCDRTSYGYKSKPDFGLYRDTAK